MKKFLLSTIILLAIVLVGCEKEQNIYLGENVGGKVDFTATNLTVANFNPIDSAISTQYYDGFYESDYYDYEKRFTIEFTYQYMLEYEEELTFNPLEIPLYCKNTLWAGGNNMIRIEYTPSCAEEKSATFTMPDGTEVELSREKSSYDWELNRDSFNKAVQSIGYSYDRLPVYAISKYTKDNIEYVNSGYILISLYNEGTNLYFDKQRKIWVMGNWH